jgi:hypothetical protein
VEEGFVELSAKLIYVKDAQKLRQVVKESGG